MTESDKQKLVGTYDFFARQQRFILIKMNFGSLEKAARLFNVDSSYLSHVLSLRRSPEWLRVSICNQLKIGYSDFWGTSQKILTKRDVKKLEKLGFYGGKND